MMRVLLILLVIIFVILPPDAQLTAIGVVRDLWLTPAGRSFAFGLLGASLGALGWYALGWNHLAEQLYQEDLTKAQSTYKARRK